MRGDWGRDKGGGGGSKMILRKVRKKGRRKGDSIQRDSKRSVESDKRGTDQEVLGRRKGRGDEKEGKP